MTRLADITEMDSLRIPNYSAVLPGTEDYIWVYSGKGPTKTHAMASALMESIERFSSLPSSGSRKFVQASFAELPKRVKVLHPDEIVEPLNFEYRDNMIMDFIHGFELSEGEEILVPAQLALFRYTPTPPSINPFSYYHTNGLASGNEIEEAICHALCEVIERDAISLAAMRASAIPYHILHTITSTLHSAGIRIPTNRPEMFVDDPTIFPDIDVSGIDFEPAKKLIERFKSAGIPLMVKDVTSDIGIPAFNASSIEWISHDYGYLAEGHGCHPDKRIALLRAITEVSQTRAANIQGARDDLRKTKYGENNTDDKRAWQFMHSSRTVKFSDIPTYFHRDILEDIRFILSRLAAAGLKNAIVVDLTNHDIGVPVVRVIVPGLETFKITKNKVMGARAKRYFRQWRENL